MEQLISQAFCKSQHALVIISVFLQIEGLTQFDSLDRSAQVSLLFRMVCNVQKKAWLKFPNIFVAIFYELLMGNAMMTVKHCQELACSMESLLPRSCNPFQFCSKHARMTFFQMRFKKRQVKDVYRRQKLTTDFFQTF